MQDGCQPVTLKSNALHYHYFKNLALPFPLLCLLEIMHYITIFWGQVMRYYDNRFLVKKNPTYFEIKISLSQVTHKNSAM
jgi:hypothetical protein